MKLLIWSVLMAAPLSAFCAPATAAPKEAQRDAAAEDVFPIPAKHKPAESGLNSSYERPRRKESRQIFNVSIGPSFFTNLNIGSTGFLFAGAFGWDLDKAIVRLNADVAVNSRAVWANVGLGVQGFFLEQADFAPYAAADFGVTYTHAENATKLPQTVTGFAMGASAGVLLFRTSTVSFDAGFRYAVLLKENGYGLPQMFLFKVGIWF